MTLRHYDNDTMTREDKEENVSKDKSKYMYGQKPVRQHVNILVRNNKKLLLKKQINKMIIIIIIIIIIIMMMMMVIK